MDIQIKGWKMHKVIAHALAFLMLWLGGAACAGTVTYVYTDAQNTPIAEADADGNITARFDYMPYGAPVPGMGPAPDGPGYTGHVNDPDTGLVYMQARYYDPAVGRFLSVDPVGSSPGNTFNFNRYNYANNNPYRFIDPNGRAPQDSWYGLNDQRFRDWVHAEKQLEGRGGARNYTKEELGSLYKEWKGLGEPRGKGGVSGRGGSQRGFISPELLFKANVYLNLIFYSSELNSGEQEALDTERSNAAKGASATGDSSAGKNSAGKTNSIAVSGEGGSDVRNVTYNSKTGEVMVTFTPETGSHISRTTTACVDKSRC